MAFPDDLTVVTVTHTLADAALRALPGVVVATPTGRQWKQGEGSVVQAAYTAAIVDGTWTLTLPAVDQFINLEAYRIQEDVPGKPRAYHVAPTLDHAPGPVDATDVITTAPRGGDIVFTAGPATDESMAQVAADPDSAFSTELKSTFASLDDDALVIDGDPLGPATVGAQPAGDDTPDRPPGAAGLALPAANLPAEAREALDITIDTTAGTRVFMGGVMVYGDTGWRDISQLLNPGFTAGICMVRRVNSTVRFVFK